MAIVKQSYTGNGVQKLFTFTFPYLDPSHVLVTVDDTPTSAWSFANDNTVEFTVAPANGAAILIYRETDSSALTATLVPGGPVPAAPINENFLQALYLGQESDDTAVGAAAQAEAAAADATAANATAAAAVATANTASTDASTALSTANTASTNASTAISTANSAVTTANSAVTTANSAVTTANAASTSAASAVSTANAASSAAAAATSTANTAATNAATALSTANTASTNASTAVSTANSAVTTANLANTNAADAQDIAGVAQSAALQAQADAAAAIAAVGNAVAYTPVSDLAALALLTPADGDFFELLDSTGAQSSGLITGVPGGLTGATDLVFRLRYDSPPGIYTFLSYFASDPLNRFADISTETVAAAALPKAGGTMTGNITFAGTQTFPIQDGTTSQKGIVQLTDSTASTSTTTAATPNSVKSSYDLANTANVAAQGALQRTGGTMTGNITFNGAQTFPVGGIQDGTTAQKGVVQLTDSTASTSTTTAATPNSVKSANDNANLRALKSGDTFTGSVTFANGSAATPGVRWNTNYGFYYDSGTTEVRLAHAGTDRVAFKPTGEIYINQRNDGGEQTFMTIYRNASYQSEWYNTSTGNVNLRDLASGNVLFSLRGGGAAAPYGLANFNVANNQTENMVGVRGAVKYQGNSQSILYSTGVISSITRNGVGDYTVNIGTRGSINYVVTAMTRVLSGTQVNVIGMTANTDQTTTSVRLNNMTVGTSPVLADSGMVHVMITEG